MEKDHFEDYLLLLVGADYQKNLEGNSLKLSPYVIESHLYDYQDHTREKFLVNYINTQLDLLRDCVFMTNDIAEYDRNIQLMMYAHLWESHRLLAMLWRIASIVKGEGYIWKIEWLRGEKNKPMPKAKILEDQILRRLSSTDLSFAKILTSSYDSELRNAFAHAQYTIDMNQGSVAIQKTDDYGADRTISFHDWEYMFFTSVMVSYHLPALLAKRKNDFVNKYVPKPFTINHPKSDSTIKPTFIEPVIVNGRVEFNFVHKGEDE